MNGTRNEYVFRGAVCIDCTPYQPFTDGERKRQAESLRHFRRIQAMHKAGTLAAYNALLRSKLTKGA